MNRRLLIDTNILLDTAISERPGWAAAVLLLDEIAYSDTTAFVSPLSLKDAYYVLSKYRNKEEALEFVMAAMDFFDVCTVDLGICLKAGMSDEPDFEDGIIRAVAESIPVDFIISRDEKAFRKSVIKRMSAQEYIDAFCEVEETTIV